MKSKRNLKGKRGSAFIVVMGIIGILMVAGISMTLMTGHAAFTVRKLHAGEQALAIAESGVADMISKMTTNYVYWMQGSNTESYADGSFYVQTSFDTVTAHVVIESTGTYGGETREVAAELLGTIWDIFDRTIAIAGGIVCGGDATLETSAMVVYGGIHSNGDIINTTGNPDVQGDVSAVGSSDITADAGYTTSTNVSPLVVPTYLPLGPWKTLAEDDGIYYSNSQSFANIDLLPSNGVIYVEGDITVGNRSIITGTLVASGSITVNNLFTHTPYNTNWPSLLAGIDLNLHNRNTYDGVLFAGNNVSMVNRRTVNGTVIALNEVTIANGATIDPADIPPAWSPNDTNEAPPAVLVGGWLK